MTAALCDDGSQRMAAPAAEAVPKGDFRPAVRTEVALPGTEAAGRRQMIRREHRLRVLLQ